MRNGEIVFQRMGGAGAPHASRLFVVEPDGSGLRPFGDPGLSLRDAAWAPDGARLVALSPNTMTQSGFRFGQLVVIDVDAGRLTEITDDRSILTSPTRSATGTEIVCARGAGTLGCHLVGVPAAGGGPFRRITGPPLPEGSRPRGTGELGPATTWARPDTGPASPQEEMPACSPDGSSPRARRSAPILAGRPMGPGLPSLTCVRLMASPWSTPTVPVSLRSLLRTVPATTIPLGDPWPHKDRDAGRRPPSGGPRATRWRRGGWV